MNKEKTTRTVTILLWCAVVSALVSAVITVGLTKFLDTLFPTHVIWAEKVKTGYSYPALMYAFEYDSYLPGKRMPILGFIIQYPTWLYSISLGNDSKFDTGIISVTIDLPNKVKAVAVFLNDRTTEFKSTDTLHFQVDPIKKTYGRSYRIAIASADLPDLNKFKVSVISPSGSFGKVTKVLYESVFKPIK